MPKTVRKTFVITYFEEMLSAALVYLGCLPLLASAAGRGLETETQERGECTLYKAGDRFKCEVPSKLTHVDINSVVSCTFDPNSLDPFNFHEAKQCTCTALVTDPRRGITKPCGCSICPTGFGSSHFAYDCDTGASIYDPFVFGTCKQVDCGGTCNGDCVKGCSDKRPECQKLGCFPKSEAPTFAPTSSPVTNTPSVSPVTATQGPTTSPTKSPSKNVGGPLETNRPTAGVNSTTSVAPSKAPATATQTPVAPSTQSPVNTATDAPVTTASAAPTKSSERIPKRKPIIDDSNKDEDKLFTDSIYGNEPGRGGLDRRLRLRGH